MPEVKEDIKIKEPVGLKDVSMLFHLTDGRVFSGGIELNRVDGFDLDRIDWLVKELYKSVFRTVNKKLVEINFDTEIDFKGQYKKELKELI